MAIQTLYPAITPSLLLDFANVKALDPRVSFVRTTTAVYYDGKTVAKAEENLLTQSQDFTTLWVGADVSRTGNTSTAPDGTTTADTITEDNTSALHLIFRGATTSGVVTLSVFAKLGSGTPFLTIGVNKDGVNWGSATFDLSGGTSTQTQAVGTYSSASATITAVAQSFYRCTLTVTTDSVTQVRIGLNNTGTPASTQRGFGDVYLGVVTNSLIVWGAQLEQRSAVTAYTPTTTEPITNYIPVLLTAASGVARFDHNPITFESLGLLVEEQRTNSLTYSDDFADAAWTKTRASITSNTIVAPDGTLTGDKLVENTDNNTHDIQFSFSATSGTTYTWSIYAKKGNRNLRLFAPSAVFTTAFSVVFDLTAGTATPAVTGSVGFITDVGNGWYRCGMTQTATATASGAFTFSLLDGTTRTYTGNGYDGIYIWGAQLEEGAFPTSYIPTVAATVTRNADAASMTGTNFSSWYRADEGTLYGELVARGSATNDESQISISDGTTSNTFGISWVGSTFNRYGAFMVTSGSGQLTGVNQSTGASPRNTNIKAAFTYKTNDAIAAFSGTLTAADTVLTLPVVNQLVFASGAGTTRFLNGTIKKIAYYPSRLPDAQLQALTS
jgi:hypothetical protein